MKAFFIENWVILLNALGAFIVVATTVISSAQNNGLQKKLTAKAEENAELSKKLLETNEGAASRPAPLFFSKAGHEEIIVAIYNHASLPLYDVTMILEEMETQDQQASPHQPTGSEYGRISRTPLIRQVGTLHPGQIQILGALETKGRKSLWLKVITLQRNRSAALEISFVRQENGKFRDSSMSYTGDLPGGPAVRKYFTDDLTAKGLQRLDGMWNDPRFKEDGHPKGE